MLGRHVERFEVVVVVFELVALDDEKPEAREDGFDALAEDGERMAVTDARPASRQRDVDRTCRVGGWRWRLAASLRARASMRILQLVDLLSELRTVLRRRLSERLEHGGDEPAFAREVLVADGPEVRSVRAFPVRPRTAAGGHQCGEGGSADTVWSRLKRPKRLTWISRTL